MARKTPDLRKKLILTDLLAGRCTLRRLSSGQWQCEPPPHAPNHSTLRALSRAADALLAEGKLMLVVGGRARLTDLGRLSAQKPKAGDLADQHRALSRTSLPDGHQPRINLAESPLQWLASRKDLQGRSFLSTCEVEAGERLRRDFTMAGLTPQITAKWTPPQDRGRGVAGAQTYSDTVVAARQRISRACTALGPDLSGLLLDICGFLKGLQEVESARGWPVRTAKVVLKLALAQLARHYGLSDTATGRAHQPMRQWGAADYRPVQDLSGCKGGVAADTLDHGPQTV